MNKKIIALLSVSMAVLAAVIFLPKIIPEKFSRAIATRVHGLASNAPQIPATVAVSAESLIRPAIAEAQSVEEFPQSSIEPVKSATIQPQAQTSVQPPVQKPPAQKPAEVKKDSLVIPKIGVSAPVLAMGNTSDGKMAVPDNYTQIGWYKYGAYPGQVGSAVLGAHVDNGSTINGVFKHLKDLVVGDTLYYVDSQGNTLQFKVTAIKVYDYTEKDTTEVFAQNDKARLNLITCHGTWLPSVGTYSKRLVVYTELVTE